MLKISDTSAVTELLAMLRTVSQLPADAATVEELQASLPGLTVRLIRGASRKLVRDAADACLAVVDPLAGGGPGWGHTVGPRTDGQGAWFAVVVIRQWT